MRLSREWLATCGLLLAVCGAAVASRAWAQDAGARVASGGGNAPHHAMDMQAQLASVNGMLGERPDLGPPQGIDPGFWAVLMARDNAVTQARVELGRRLYFDPRLSGDGTVACATCHDTSRGFTDRRSTSEGIREQVGKRNAPTTMNAAFFSMLFLDATHPETYPKFQTQMGRVALLRDMINWCIEHPVRGKALASDDPRMRAMEAYLFAQRKGKALDYGRH